MRLDFASLFAGLVVGSSLLSCGGTVVEKQSPTSKIRTAACQQMQDATCDWAADRCKVVSRSSCDIDMQSLFCRGDDAAQACTAALATNSCSTLPGACVGVADPAPAVEYCNQLVGEMCSRLDACAIPISSCVTTLTASLNCSSAVGARPSIDQCLAELPTAACDSLKVGVAPDSCQGVIRVSQSSAAPSPDDHGLTPTLFAPMTTPGFDVQ